MPETLIGDYYIPCLILPAEKEQPIGLWVQRINNIQVCAEEIVEKEIIFA